MSSFEIRGARRNELGRVAELAQLVEPAQLPMGVEEVKLAARQKEQDWHVAVGPGQVIVGAALTLMHTVGRRPKDLLTVRSLAVDPAHRGRGVGTALLGQTVKFGQDRLVSKIEVPVLQETPELRGLFRRTGFAAIMPNIFEIKVAQPYAEGTPLSQSEPKQDGRLKQSLQKKRIFLSNAYPEAEFTDEEIETIFDSLPEILNMQREYFHPRTRNRLDEYTQSLLCYANSDLSAREALRQTPFGSPNTFHVWQKGFSKSVADVIDHHSLRSLAFSLPEEQQAKAA